MSKVVGKIFGGGSKKQSRALRQAQAVQATEIASQRAKLEKIKASRARIRKGGARSVLAFVEQGEHLKSTFGGVT